MVSSYSSLGWVLFHWPIWLCLDSCTFLSVYFVFIVFILHGGTDDRVDLVHGIEA